MIAERGQGGGFTPICADLCRSVDLRKVNRRVFEALIRAGALDALGANRATLMLAALDDGLRAAEQHSARRETGQNDLFGLETTAVAAGTETGRFVTRVGARADPSAGERWTRWACISPGIRSMNTRPS